MELRQGVHSYRPGPHCRQKIYGYFVSVGSQLQNRRELCFRALSTEGEARVLFYREGFGCGGSDRNRQFLTVTQVNNYEHLN